MQGVYLKDFHIEKEFPAFSTRKDCDAIYDRRFFQDQDNLHAASRRLSHKTTSSADDWDYAAIRKD